MFHLLPVLFPDTMGAATEIGATFLTYFHHFLSSRTYLMQNISIALKIQIMYTSAGNRWKISARLIIHIFDRLIDYNRLLLMLICPLNSVQYMADFP